MALCRQYLSWSICVWGSVLKWRGNVENLPGDALIPPLVLQPLLENAVYHGIERTEPGEIVINIYRARDRCTWCCSPLRGWRSPFPAIKWRWRIS